MKQENDRKVKACVVVGRGRSGSTYLLSLLDSHPLVRAVYGEIFHPEQAFDLSEYSDPVEYLKGEIFVRSQNEEVVAVKILEQAYSRFDEQLWDYFERENVFLIHMYRTNKLDQFLSWALAELNETFVSKGEPYACQEISLDLKQLKTHMNAYTSMDEMFHKKLKSGEFRYREVEYQQLVQETPAVTGELLDFLGLERIELTSHFTRQRSRSQREIVVNYEEVKAFLEDEGLGHFLDGK